MPYHVLVKQKYTVAALEALGDDWGTDCPALTFLQQSHNDANTTSACRGYRAMFELLAERGPSALTSAMLHEASKEDGILELIKGRLRLLCFIENDTIFLTNGYLKSTQKADKAEVAKAARAKSKYLDSCKPPRRTK